MDSFFSPSTTRQRTSSWRHNALPSKCNPRHRLVLLHRALFRPHRYQIVREIWAVSIVTWHRWHPRSERCAWHREDAPVVSTTIRCFRLCYLFQNLQERHRADSISATLMEPERYSRLFVSEPMAKKEITSSGSTKTNTISKPIQHESFSTLSSWRTWFKLESGQEIGYFFFSLANQKLDDVILRHFY